VYVKLSLCLINEALCYKDVWGNGCIDLCFLPSALVGGERSASRPGRFTPEERAPDTYLVGGWVGLRASLDIVEKRKFSILLILMGHDRLHLCVYDATLLEDRVNTIKKNTEYLIHASKKVDLEVNTSKTKYMLMFRHQKA
jgi:hypothetical protein